MSGFVFPDYQRNLVALHSRILEHFGAESDKTKLDLELKNSKKLGLVLLDGLGWDLYSSVKPIKPSFASKMTTVFPSTTSTALTSLLTGLTPGQHGIIGYKTFYKRLGGAIKPLEFTYASSNYRNLLSRLTHFRTIFSVKTIFQKLSGEGIRSTVISPSFIDGSEFSDFNFFGASKIIGYSGIWDALYHYKKEMNSGRSRFIYMYVPDIDSLEHRYGSSHPAVSQAAEDILYALSKSSEGTSRSGSTIVTADHGHVKLSGITNLGSDKALMKKLEIPPFGDSRAILLRSRYDVSKELSNYNLGTFKGGQRDALLGGISKELEDTMPDIIAVPKDKEGYVFLYGDREPSKEQVSSHGGLSQEEMEVPLLVL